ncbi:hypothetical protein [Micromonospora sp. ATCC 39149]|uniref:hypothetical protein n=1 Tax=Micromonospora sp. (strain ATCC 39149 / NRRL 15099 / SCC 1413) TaxID=219305 RepID=UPI00055DE5ED|nr:hypothetical protein [Micromonospora sp. ATCC 39149]
MALFKLTTPTPGFTGKVAGVAFADGTATVDSETHGRALAYFRRRGYRVEEASEPVVTPAEQTEPVITEPPARGAAKDAWIAFATSEAAGEKRLTLDEATALKRDELAEHVLGPKED